MSIRLVLKTMFICYQIFLPYARNYSSICLRIRGEMYVPKCVPSSIIYLLLCNKLPQHSGAYNNKH